MKQLTAKQKMEIKGSLADSMETALQESLGNIYLGFLPPNVSFLMAEAAYSVLMASSETSQYIEEEGFLDPPSPTDMSKKPTL